MKRLFTIAVGSVLILISCAQNGKEPEASTITIISSAKDSFFKAVSYIDTSDGEEPFKWSSMGAVFVPEMMGDEEEIQEAQGTAGFEMPCQCAFRNDSLVVMSGLAYEGGFAFIALVKEGHSETMLNLFGEGRKWKFENKEFIDHIKIPSLKNEIILSAKFPPKIDDVLFGIFEVETPVFYELEDNVPEKQLFKVKIYFSCQVFSEIL